MKKYEVIKEDILNKILTGFYEVGTLIPKEVDLAKEYNVSRPTVRKAIQVLVYDGYLDRKQRIGTRVIKKKIDQEFTQSLTSFNKEMTRKGVSPKTKVISFSKVEPNDEVKEKLDLLDDDLAYRLVRLRFGDDKPIVIVTTYLPAKYLPDLMDFDFNDDSLYSVLDQKKMSIKSISRELEITFADELTSELLGINENEPLFYFISVGKTSEKIPIEFSIARYRSDINTFKFEVMID